MPARPAVVGDAEEIVRLAEGMFTSMGTSLDGPGWPEAGLQAVRERLGEDVMVSVVDDPEVPGRLAACAAGSLHRRLPRPDATEFLAGYVQWVATEERWRREGLAAEAMRGLLDWFLDRNVRAVELHSTAMAEDLYISLGFVDQGPRAMRIRDLPAWSREQASST